jgi:hypothetical protein
MTWRTHGVIGMILAGVAVGTAARAAWAPGGNPLCTAPQNQNLPVAVADGSGGMIVAWLDFRRTVTTAVPDLYALRVNADGTVPAGWLPNGNVVCDSGAASQPSAVPDGSGGALVLWLDNRPSGRGIYAQRIRADGQIMPGWPAGGRFLLAEYPYDGVIAAPDGAGGAWFAWRAYPVSVPSGYGYAMKVSHVTVDGTFAPGWSAAGKSVGANTGISHLQLVADAPGAVAFGLNWFDEYGIGFANGATVGRLRDDQSLRQAFIYTGPNNEGPGNVGVAPDAGGGWFANWRFGGVDYVQHYDAAGGGLWAGPPQAPVSGGLVHDGGSGVWLIGTRPGSTRLEVHRRLADGTPPTGWTSGIAVTEPSSLGSFSAGRFTGGLCVGWSENTSGAGFDIRAAAVLADPQFAPGFAYGGNAVSAVAGDQVTPTLVMSGSTAALLAWTDGRPAATSTDIDAGAVPITVPLAVPGREGVVFGITRVTPNPVHHALELTCTLAGHDPAIVEIVDVAGRVALRRTLHPAGPGSLRVPLGLGDRPGGVYWISLAQGARRANARFVVTR